jgi:uncharacterized protein YggE
MNQNNNSFLKFLLVFVLGLVSSYLIQNFTPLANLPFLNLEKSTITVHGSAQENVFNQLAEFTAGIEIIAEEKEEAVNSATEIMDQLLLEIKDFGISEKDIQTTQVSVYQEDEAMIDPIRNPEIMIVEEDETGKTGDWRANINVTITLRSEDSELLKSQSEELLNILNNSQANYVYGPNFRLDQENLSEIDLINSAVADARKKAEAIATNNQQQVIKILEIIESDINYQPFYRGEFAVSQDSSSPSLEPGSSTLSKTITVTFQVK